MSDSIRVLLFQEDGFWVAQGLEHDICAQAKTLEDVQINFGVSVQLECKEEGGIQRLPKAPQYFQDKWNERAGNFRPNDAKSDGNFEYGILAA